MENTKNTNKIVIDPFTGGIKFEPYKDCKSKNPKDEAELTRVRELNPQFCPIPSKLTLKEKFDTCMKVACEVQVEEQLWDLLKKDDFFTCYDGFEPSGRMHIAQGVMKAINVNRLIESGGIFVFWVADLFALLNNKLWGDLDKIQTTGKYFIEVWKAVGMKMSNVKFLWASEHIQADSEKYWMRVLDIATKHTITKMVKCTQIMGREESDDLSVAQLLYPCMQAADVFFLKTDICQLGQDQKKVNMLARDYVTNNYSNDKSIEKPVVLSNIMIPGLMKGCFKMSKSDPDNAIFMEDTEEEIKRKIKKAYCPEMDLFENPCIDWFKYFIQGYYGEFELQRKEEHGGNKLYKDIKEVEEDFVKGDLFPKDLKDNLARGLNNILEPVRQHFAQNAEARKLFEQVKGYSKRLAEEKASKK